MLLAFSVLCLFFLLLTLVLVGWFIWAVICALLACPDAQAESSDERDTRA